MSEYPGDNANLNKCAWESCRNVLSIRNNYIGPFGMKYCHECSKFFECSYCASMYIFVSDSPPTSNICFECAWKFYKGGNYPASVLKEVTNLPGKTQARILINEFIQKFPRVKIQEIEDFYRDQNRDTYYIELYLAEKALTKAYEECKYMDQALASQLLIENIRTLFELGKTTDALSAYASLDTENINIEYYIILMDYCGTEYLKKEKFELEKMNAALVGDQNDLNLNRLRYFLNYKGEFSKVENLLQDLRYHTPINIKLFIDCLRYAELKNLNEESLLNAIHLAKSYCPSYVLISSLYVLLSRYYKYYKDSLDKSLSSLEEAAKIWLRKNNAKNEFAVKILIKLAKAYIATDTNKSKAIVLHCMKFADRENIINIKVKALRVLKNVLVSNREFEKVCAVERKLWEIKNSS